MTTQQPSHVHSEPGLNVAYIADEPGGYVVSNDALDYLDTSGPRYATKAGAYRAASRYGYTRYNDRGVFRLIPKRYR